MFLTSPDPVTRGVAERLVEGSVAQLCKPALGVKLATDELFPSSAIPLEFRSVVRNPLPDKNFLQGLPEPGSVLWDRDDQEVLLWALQPSCSLQDLRHDLLGVTMLVR